MPLTLPNLDDLRWKDLVEEGRALIAASAETWTDYNASDPGITLMELFAFVSGTLIYQLNRITGADTALFLSLMHGSGPNDRKIEAEKEAAIPTAMRATRKAAANAQRKRDAFKSLSLPLRAVTPQDYESLVGAMPGVARAKIGRAHV